MMKWIKIGKAVNAEGMTITYRLEGTPYTVESRKRHIPHSNRPGTWDLTTYHVMRDGAEVAEKSRLSFAKEYAEVMYKEDESK